MIADVARDDCHFVNEGRRSDKCGFRKFPDSDFSNSGTAIPLIRGQLPEWNLSVGSRLRCFGNVGSFH